MLKGNSGVEQFDIDFDPTRDILLKLLPGTNKIRVIAPLGDKVYCLGVLSLAERAVQDFNPPPTPVVEAPASALQGIPEPDFQTGKRR